MLVAVISLKFLISKHQIKLVFMSLLCPVFISKPFWLFSHEYFRDLPKKIFYTTNIPLPIIVFFASHQRAFQRTVITLKKVAGITDRIVPMITLRHGHIMVLLILQSKLVSELHCWSNLFSMAESDKKKKVKIFVKQYITMKISMAGHAIWVFDMYILHINSY